MQKLETRNTYTPTDASQVRGNCDYVLNREQSPSVHSLKTVSNSSDENRQSGKTEQDLRVPVLNMRGEPLMPTNPAKARHLLDQGKAKVVTRKPFTIQLKYATGENRQKITLGVDAGYRYAGFSATTEQQELISGKVKLRTNIPKKLLERRKYRRNRRGRKWYRQPRFDNRKRDVGWLAPSIRHKLNSHIRLIKKLKERIPITKIIIEVATFDTQKMKNPEISGKEYQQGTLKGYEVREYLLEKWNRKCVYCGKENAPLEIEHIVPKSRGGSDRVSNLTISCHKCNQDKGNKTAKEYGYPEIQKQAKKSLKSVAFMNTVRWNLVNKTKEIYPDTKVFHTYGYITKKNRIELCLDKSHINDAFVISGGKDQRRTKSYTVKQVRRNNRSIQINRKGFGRSIRKQRYDIQPRDLIKKDRKMCRAKGVFSYGKYVRINDGEENYWKTENVELVCYGKGMQFEVNSSSS